MFHWVSPWRIQKCVITSDHELLIDFSLLGVPHQAERDDEFRGVQIKKDTIILACEW